MKRAAGTCNTPWAILRRKSAPATWQSAFTLIELLVVVAILALLIALLLPSLAGARDQARAAVCGARLREGTRGAQMWILELQKDYRLPTNCGWAAGALKEVQGQTELFNCPSDPNPTPCPAFLVGMYFYKAGQGPFDSEPYALASPDSPFSKFFGETAPGERKVGMEDRIAGDWFGGDADTDLVFKYTAPKGAQYSTVTLTETSASDNFRLYAYSGKTIFANAKTDGMNKPFQAPLLWGSYGLNIAAGYRNTPGMPIVLMEYAKSGIMPETIVTSIGGSWPQDQWATKLRLRHGGKLLLSNLEMRYFRDTTDSTYVARTKANCGFIDGHVEPIQAKRLYNGAWNRSLIFGNRAIGVKGVY